MATPSPTQASINKNRVVNLTEPHACICPLCDGLVWLPICCQDCGTPYCKTCVKNRQLDSSAPIECPFETSSDSTESKCSGFVEHKCSNLVRQALSKLIVKCRYEEHGCKEIPPYNHLETHEEVCGYQQKMCAGCQKDFALKDFQAHESACPLVILTCSECNTNYKRQDQGKHTETKCLREQLLQVGAYAKNETKSLYEQVLQMKATAESVTNSLREQLLQMKATAENETNSLRAQVQNLTARLGQLETSPTVAAEPAVQVIEEAQTA